jgi:hypothetical protein
MAQLIQGRNTTEYEGKKMVVPVKANTKLFEGAMAAADANGFAVPGAKVAALTYLGRVEVAADSTGLADGVLSVVIKRGVFKYENDVTNPVTIAHVKKDCYFIDDQTVTSLITGSSKAGVILGLENGQVIVDMR